MKLAAERAWITSRMTGYAAYMCAVMAVGSSHARPHREPFRGWQPLWS